MQHLYGLCGTICPAPGIGKTMARLVLQAPCGLLAIRVTSAPYLRLVPADSLVDVRLLLTCCLSWLWRQRRVLNFRHR
jgi:hypothetical protein